MKEIWRHRTLLIFIYIIKDVLLLNLLYFGTVKLMSATCNSSCIYLATVINLSYLLGATVIKPVKNFRKLTLTKIMEHSAYRLLISALIVTGCLFFAKSSGNISLMFVFVFYLSAYMLLVFAQWLTRATMLLAFAASGSITVTGAVILGAGTVGKKLFRELNDNIYSGIKILGFFDDDPAGKNDMSVLGTIEQAKEYIKKNRVEAVFCTLPLSERNTVLDFLDFAEQNVISFHIIPSITYCACPPAILDNIGDIPVLSIRRAPLSHTHNAFVKRAIDIAVSIIFLTTLFPLIYLILGILIKLSSSGPVFFIQERTGIKGRNFKCYKFRSMKCNDEAHTRQATAGDKRKTRIGSFMRHTNLDEVPQFINVLKGDMSLVGPRPHMLLHTEEYSRLIKKYMVRHFIKPGITGWAQVNGFRGETDRLEDMEGRIRKDIWYLENWSILLDFEIMMKTILVTIKGDRKAY
jgi:putative colanic acid biosynthesis UDP-glucose lipid carrier transferase